MTESAPEIKPLFIKMLENTADTLKDDTLYQKDIEELGELKVQWNICGFDAYQIYTVDKYTFKFGEKLENPDISIKMDNEELAVKFFNGEKMGHNFRARRDYRGQFDVNYIAGTKEKPEKIPYYVAKIYHEDFKHPVSLLKIPALRQGRKKPSYEGEYGSYIPINKSLGTYENQVIPFAIFKHFIEKASNIVITRNCLCRQTYRCKDHPIDIGCMYMGDESKKIKLDEKRAAVTKEQALEIVKNAIASGLIPILGRSIGEAALQGVKDTGKILSCCFCCSCCCMNRDFIKYGPNEPVLYSRMKGVTVSVNEDLCEGCGKCMEVCAFKGRKMVNGKAKVDQERCLGCGRCADACPTGATTIKIDDMKYVNDLISTIEKFVDVLPQPTEEKVSTEQ
jgi:ferredoxin